MSLSVLQKEWKNLDQDKQARFTKLFAEKITIFYYHNIKKYYKEWNLEITKVISAKNKRKITVIAKKQGYDDVCIVFSIHPVKDEWKFYDIKVLGVSLLANYQTQFRAIKKEKLAELLENS